MPTILLYLYSAFALYYSCPISGGSSCSGSPPSCSKGQTCITQSGTVTKYQCSLTGVNYDTQNLCTSACFRTASCNTNYQCTYDNTVFSTASDCQNNSKFARILVEQAYDQLGYSWGGYDDPPCTNLTFDDLKRLDFSRMDFSEFIQDIEAKMKGKIDESALQQKVKNRIAVP